MPFHDEPRDTVGRPMLSSQGYEGAWLDNRAHGHGTFTESSGTSYEGPTLKEWSKVGEVLLCMHF